jgi:hypothetical protein
LYKKSIRYDARAFPWSLWWTTMSNVCWVDEIVYDVSFAIFFFNITWWLSGCSWNDLLSHIFFHNEETLLLLNLLFLLWLLLFLYSHIYEGTEKDSRHAKRMLWSSFNGLYIYIYIRLSTPSFIFHLTDIVTKVWQFIVIKKELNEHWTKHLYRYT